MNKVINLNNQSEWLTFDDVLLLPNYSEVTPSKTDTTTKLTEKIKLPIPILASPMDTVCESAMALRLGKIGGYGIIHRNLSIEKQVGELKLVLKAGVKAGAAVGVGVDFKDRVAALIKAGVKEICVDSAHGHTKHVIEAIKKIKIFHSGVEVIAGNVATYEGADDLFKAGAAAVKVGMGPGSICTTRIMSGMGVPQLSAIVAGAKAAKKYKKSIIADGGIRTSGDLVKALAAGAAAVMLGSLLAGTDAAPGKLVTYQGKKYKTYRGMGSVGAMKQGSAERYGQKKTDKILVAEGVEGLVEYKGKLEDFVYQLVGGLRSGLAYLGAKNLKELRQKAKFIRISRAGVYESRPHSILLLDR
ncbi:MAG: IMP dehydrogenase [Candidatus Beckwithbacteria bacterium]|nr:IMP dehydrogenase [Candidatus Beckwithbacteria bacterium]